MTRDNVGHRLAIILDGELYSAPNIQSPIETGNGQITGSFTVQEAQELANVLQNPLRAPLKYISSEDVDPTLGKDSIRSGVSASIYAVIFVSLFMLGYYWIAGLAANVALIINIHHLDGRHVFRGHDAHVAGYRGCGIDHRHGGGRERADLRTSA